MHMIGDVKKAVFLAIMSSDDYLHAFEQLMHLNLKKTQEREIVRILVNCCQAEKNYNPFYEMLAIKLCSYDANFKYTFKYCLWDYLKDLERLEVKQIVHLSKLFGRLMATELPLHFLKVLDFEQLSKPQVLFLHLMLESLL